MRHPPHSHLLSDKFLITYVTWDDWYIHLNFPIYDFVIWIKCPLPNPVKIPLINIQIEDKLEPLRDQLTVPPKDIGSWSLSTYSSTSALLTNLKQLQITILELENECFKTNKFHYPFIGKMLMAPASKIGWSK